jgi:hypothetical protein
MNKSYKKSEGVYVLDTEQGQYTLDEAANTVVPSSFTKEELDAMEPDFFGGNNVGTIQNYASTLNTFAAFVDQLNLEGQ